MADPGTGEAERKGSAAGGYGEHRAGGGLSSRVPPQEKKIFMVQGPYPVIRSLLRARGWVERKFRGAGKAGGRLEQHHGSQEKQLREKEGDAIHNLMSRLVRNQVPYFIWTNRCNAIDCRLLQQDQVVNHYARVGAFTTKEGLCQNLRNLPWFDQADPDTFFPRCYRLRAVDERQAFIGEHGSAGHPPPPPPQMLSPCSPPNQCSQYPPWPGPPLPPHLVEEALQVCRQHLGSLGHQDIDRDPPAPQAMGTDWDRFLQDYYRVVHEGAGLALSGPQREQCQALLRRLARGLPQLGMEGYHNVWILKPGAKSRGRGIVCMARLEEMLRLAGVCTAPSARVGEWVVQKYVERPLLIFGTKFDIRQWFLVTDWNPLTVWFYQESYLRFCSRPFSLCRLDPARHLCNVSIQKRYRLVRGRHPRLPPDQTWSCRQLQAYLAQVGRAGAWQQVMVPGMKAAVVSALRSAQDLVEHRKSSFELYGADFIFGEDCQPWLLEINASPTMAPSSAVTRRLCASVQQDTLRVVIDRRDNPACPTGAFELIYKEAAVPVPPYVGLKLMVQGCSLKKPKLARHQLRGKPPTAAPCAPQPLVTPGISSKATKVPQPGAARGEPAPLGRWSRCYPPSTTCCARSRGLPPIRRPHGHPPAALPRLNVHPLPRVPIPPPQGASGSPLGQTLPSVRAGVLQPPGLAPGAWPPCPGQLSSAARRRRMADPKGKQRS
uniref:Tubulin monoglycylase TTLL3 n=1 Tax=Calidris pygmaea TaxID=425635 RepID=A0A8C3K5L3_9CHAR